ncbi:ECF transporter S component [Brevibacillus fortis]|uniref:ECF transporter S component n=1 Tax=Brevibacillus fortis TaxID=2126352 RepID=A0A2P7VK82_9BACL|nr:ECF transporter S component [Brevibacillus fortis]MED1782246.1 ECF transporter S component [Brevibacillus fortis]PSJ99584.1 ECF transporter S component [Brevibacillus fortis]
MNIALLILLALLSLFAILLLVLEKSKMDEKIIAVIATLGAIASIARVPFAAIPNVQPTTFLVMLSGYVFGIRVGFLVGVIAAVFSNFFLGQGTWTLWQMMAWGLSGAFAGGLRYVTGRSAQPPLSKSVDKWLFVGSCTAWGFLFDWIMNLWIFVGMGAFMNIGSFLALYSAGLAFDIAHAAGNFLFALLLGPGFARIFTRYHRKLVISQLTVRKSHDV